MHTSRTARVDGSGKGWTGIAAAKLGGNNNTTSFWARCGRSTAWINVARPRAHCGPDPHACRRNESIALLPPTPPTPPPHTHPHQTHTMAMLILFPLAHRCLRTQCPEWRRSGTSGANHVHHSAAAYAGEGRSAGMVSTGQQQQKAVRRGTRQLSRRPLVATQRLET